ncbi:glutamate synthase-related protein [Frankia sp. AiPs1]|uniref:glutamate synthase-related protein n=1 Tax=Frankia sp. AiPs1 TaxID=573493 RepID=UPI0020436EBC|nr:glutamate synthase-related protein [Frankia sp. AiPs1]MCM3925606.1 glutamate synthase-related protein [Frankia sp. AiPs1]
MPRIAGDLDEGQMVAHVARHTRAMMTAAGCIRVQRCHTNTCPTRVATHAVRRICG